MTTTEALRMNGKLFGYEILGDPASAIVWLPDAVTEADAVEKSAAILEAEGRYPCVVMIRKAVPS